MIWQLMCNGSLSVGRYLPLVVALWLVRSVAGFFDLSLGAVLVLAAYAALWFRTVIDCGVPGAIAMAAGVGAVAAATINWVIYEPLRRRGASSVVLLLSSLGVALVLENLLGMLCGRQTRSLTGGVIGHVFRIGGVGITTTQIIVLASSIGLTVVFILGVWCGPIGLRMRAIASDSELATIVGVERARMLIIVYLLAGVLGAVSGCFLALEFDIRPNLGLQSLLTAAVAAIAGGRHGAIGPVAGIIIVAAAQQAGAALVGPAWQDACTLAILVVVFLLRPVRILGQHSGRAAA